ncbi:phosphotransferase [Microlunatus soli]|uniref:phosphotransferase n=1 Tax=Microlunatus soli TaxID=630515 RepID=UPI0012F823A9|nr:phosphotransferase [Microlunatus soli]
MSRIRVEQAEQLPRFGALRPEPPAEVLDRLSGAEPGSTWTARQLGDHGGYPNGGLWRVTADRSRSPGPTTAVVKRTGPAYLGTFPAWHLHSDQSEPHWWGREAEFYRSELATTGWTDDVRPARCYVDEHDGCCDLWLEDVADIPAPFEVCRRAVVGLAHWQVAHPAAQHRQLPDSWIPSHLALQGLDNDRTLAHPGWPSAFERGVDPALRELVRQRLTDPAEIARLLSDLPQVLTHYDFHNGNIGTVGDRIVLFDWAYLGRGPIGHDAGHLALTLEPRGVVDPVQAWDILQTTYCEALIDAGWAGDPAVVGRSMALSNRLRLGWGVDHLLGLADRATEAQLAAESRRLMFIARLAS